MLLSLLSVADPPRAVRLRRGSTPLPDGKVPMGLEALCDITIDGTTATGRVHLEPTGIRVRGALERTIPLTDVVSSSCAACPNPGWSRN